MTEKRQFVRDLSAGQQVNDLFLLSFSSRGQARNGPFWTLKLQDATGTIEAKLWFPGSQAFDQLETGQFVRASGQVGTFRDQIQLNLETLELLGSAPPDVDFSQFIPESEEKPEALLGKIQELLNQRLEYRPWRRFARQVLDNEEIRSRLLAAPGAKKMHHAYRGGLLEHTLSVCRVVVALCELYPVLDRDTLLTAGAFHDLGKAWEISSGLTRDYTDQGQLLGHIVIGLEVLEPFLAKARGLDPEVVLHFKHLLVSHHGFMEFGSPSPPKTPEALILHYADNIDAKIDQFKKAVEDPAKVGVAGYVASLERYVFNPKRVNAMGEGKQSDSKGLSQCSLPLKA